VFSPLQKAYGRQIEDMARPILPTFLKTTSLVFRIAFTAAMMQSNIQGGLRGTGNLAFDPESVISTLDLQTPALGRHNLGFPDA
jgi:hypothetical protein